MATPPTAIRAAFAAAYAAAGSLGLLVEVQHYRFVEAEDGYGTPSHDPVPVPRMAMVKEQEGALPGPNGREVRYRAVVSFIAPVDVGLRDKLVLPSGFTGPILPLTGGTLDSETGKPFFRTVHLG